MTKIVTFGHGRPSQRLVFASCSLITTQGAAQPSQDRKLWLRTHWTASKRPTGLRTRYPASNGTIPDGRKPCAPGSTDQPVSELRTRGRWNQVGVPHSPFTRPESGRKGSFKSLLEGYFGTFPHLESTTYRRLRRAVTIPFWENTLTLYAGTI
jgi:hypothetical protein